jgi:riboflavin kinase/FMN adenylyltransferase
MEQRVIALGFFDGVHLGHAALLRRAAQEAKKRGCLSAAFTFNCPPKEVITGIPYPLINSPEDREDLICHLFGINEVLSMPFDHEMMTTPWDRFITEIMVKRYHAIHLVAGHDHHFGHMNTGSPKQLQLKCAELGLSCDIIPKVEMDGITVSSTYIRRLITMGQMEQAVNYLGHPHVLSGTVKHGKITPYESLYSTINLQISSHVLSPSQGVYISRVYLPNEESYIGVTNVGNRLAVDKDSNVIVQTFILDFGGDLNNLPVHLTLYKRLRDKIDFNSIEALKSQIILDADRARSFFATPKKS